MPLSAKDWLANAIHENNSNAGARDLPVMLITTPFAKIPMAERKR
jgi:hypothetical protein